MENVATNDGRSAGVLKPQPIPNNMFNVPVTFDSFFRLWLIFLRPFVYLTDREIQVMSSFLKHRYRLSKVITDPVILDSQLLSKDVREQVAEDCNISQQHLYVIIGNLRKHNIITDKGINQKLVPNIRENDDGTFRVLIRFVEDKA